MLLKNSQWVNCVEKRTRLFFGRDSGIVVVNSKWLTNEGVSGWCHIESDLAIILLCLKSPPWPKYLDPMYWQSTWAPPNEGLQEIEKGTRKLSHKRNWFDRHSNLVVVVLLVDHVINPCSFLFHKLPFNYQFNLSYICTKQARSTSQPQVSLVSKKLH